MHKVKSTGLSTRKHPKTQSHAPTVTPKRKATTKTKVTRTISTQTSPSSTSPSNHTTISSSLLTSTTINKTAPMTTMRRNNQRCIKRFFSSSTNNGPIYHQQFLKATGSVSKQDQEALEAHRTKHNTNPLNADDQLPNIDGNGEEEEEDIPLSAEELFYEMPPLAQDMFELEPREHRSTLIWLPDCFESHSIHGKSFQMMMAKQLRVVVPNPPVRECTVLGGEEQKAWYDVMSVPFKPDQCDLDYTGMKVSMYQLHQLIRDEAIRIGQTVAPFNAPADEIERLGTERVFLGGFGQGAALALFSGLRYPKKLAGIISHSGYIPFINQTAEAAKLLEQNQRKQWELDAIEQQKINQAEKLTKQTTQEHFQQQSSFIPHEHGEKVFDIATSAPNLRTPLYVLHNHTDTVFPWLELAQPSFIKAVQAPLRCKMELRMGKSEGHSIASLDLLEMQFWQNDIIFKAEKNMPSSDFYEREKLRELGEFGDSTIVVDKYSPHADRVTMPWTSPRILESANVAQQDVKRVEELLKLIPKHPERLEEIANEIELLNKEADDELWKAYIIEAQQFIKHHEKYMTQRRQQEQLRWKGNHPNPTDDNNNNIDNNNNGATTQPSQQQDQPPLSNDPTHRNVRFEDKRKGSTTTIHELTDNSGHLGPIH